MSQPHFPKMLSSQIAFDIARTILDGFDKHYRIFREISQAAAILFGRGEWQTLQHNARDRIQFYEKRVRECVQILEDEYDPADLTDQVWREVKLHYMGLLTDHLRPELAETFFNSVCTKLLNRAYYHNDFIFLRPATATEYLEQQDTPPTYRVYYPATDGLLFTLRRIVTNFRLQAEFEDLDRDVALVEARLKACFGQDKLEPNHQIQVLANLFFRNKAAYIIGKVINGNRDYPFVIPVMHRQKGSLVLDTVLTEAMQITILFSFTRAYFMVDMEVPSAYVQFIRSILPRKPRSEIYTMLGLQKHGKNLFYRDFLHHLKYSSDQIAAAPGIRGLVMLVFALPSFPYVFKLIKDSFPPPKETTRELVQEKYQLVKNHDRVGRMADTLEYSDVAFPRSRFSEELLAEIQRYAPSLLEVTRDEVVIRHLYIERRMTPLNIWLTEAEQRGDLAAMEHGVREYGNAIKDLIAANIFPGDMLYKNFGVTRHGRVVFYDYDEIEYITDCQFRRIPAPRNEEDEMAAEPWYPVARNDVFPEQFGSFLLGNPQVRRCFLQHHADLLTPEYWQQKQARIQRGKVEDIFPYPQEIRFHQT
ncbi:bifunctional isocitrate dehydrogenase kinase/phosphatase [Undibacterium squillarum]|uniref:Isocitrate dehydrogenase kinase/phosphatase n=1 Tax=Undibacterium squillarum TaxID=1131567 RepID=A0ABQ2Y086_9BURK|nr:bifunctional isocitrate dehydrogenase kinase/phosphatase [Undibacterium squillarum]GGX48139.1 isocitrate dehydrogenase kinase/phosphatase [Undibacterium squillarum]